MQNELLLKINKYLNECDGDDNFVCLRENILIRNQIALMHLNHRREYKLCLSRANECKIKGCSSMVNYLMEMPSCLTQEEICIDNYRKNLDFVESCYKKIN